MRRAGSALVAAGLATSIALLVAACSPAPTTTPGAIATASIEAPASGSPGATAGASDAAPGSVPDSPVTGVLVDIDATGLSEVTGFTLRLDDGRSFEFLIGTLENGVEFPPGHLAEHMATSTPIRVSFRVDGTNLVAYRLEDAEAPSAPPSAPPTAVLHAENRGGPAFIIRIGGRDVITVPCDGGETLIPGQAGVPDLPWALEVERVRDGKLILTRDVADLPRWLVQIGEALVGNLPTSPVEGVPGPSCPPEG